MAAVEHEFTRCADVRAALADPALVPLRPAESAVGRGQVDVPGTAAWLRASVARFCAGPVHARRRALVEAELARLDPEALRAAAKAEARAAAQAAVEASTRAARTTAEPAEPGEVAATAGTGKAVRTDEAAVTDENPRTEAAEGETRAGTIDARQIAVGVLARALDLPESAAVARDVTIVAGVYFGGDDAAADAAVARLLAVVRRDGPDPLEDAANRIGLLVQACNATGSLVDAARKAGAQNTPLTTGMDAAALVAHVLTFDPPLRAMHRVAAEATSVAGVDIAEGDRVILRIAEANLEGRSGAEPLTFGAPPRQCPGKLQALAIAEGILSS